MPSRRSRILCWTGSAAAGWAGALDAQQKLLDLSNAQTRIVPSYGPVVGRAELQAEFDMTRVLFDRMLELVKKGMSAQEIIDAGVMKGLYRTFDDPFKFAYDAHKGYWAHHNVPRRRCALMGIAMKHARTRARFVARSGRCGRRRR